MARTAFVWNSGRRDCGQRGVPFRAGSSRRSRRLGSGVVSRTGGAITATMLCFPLARRVAFVRKQANSMAMRSEALAEKYIAIQMRLQAETLRNKGLGEGVVISEVASLERAIRAELALMLSRSQGGVA
ncbi:DUF6074 family protein [Bosea sp. (in: a-proteobacteria)]|uniref:DUF6074 family protein n=1 Tax=Bosea sp. (in: a-proteobacteria) TaxID=1871050 RepID=UPI00342BBD29